MLERFTASSDEVQLTVSIQLPSIWIAPLQLLHNERSHQRHGGTSSESIHALRDRFTALARRASAHGTCAPTSNLDCSLMSNVMARYTSWGTHRGKTQGISSISLPARLLSTLEIPCAYVSPSSTIGQVGVSSNHLTLQRPSIITHIIWPEKSPFLPIFHGRHRAFGDEYCTLCSLSGVCVSTLGMGQGIFQV